MCVCRFTNLDHFPASILLIMPFVRIPVVFRAYNCTRRDTVQSGCSGALEPGTKGINKIDAGKMFKSNTHLLRICSTNSNTITDTSDTKSNANTILHAYHCTS